MIKVNIYCVGNIKEAYLKDAINEYLKRLSRYAKVEIIEFKEAQIDEKTLQKSLEIEDLPILKRIKPEDFLILSDLHGKEFSSEEFALEIGKLIDEGKTLNFAIGGTYGIGDSLRSKANLRVSLSKMTFTHQFSRLILLEQIYRAFKILNNEEYHH